MAGTNVPAARDAAQVTRLLGTPEIQTLIAKLGETRWTGRPGYSIRTMVGIVLVKSLYTMPTWTRTVTLVSDHAALRLALGIGAATCPRTGLAASPPSCGRAPAPSGSFATRVS